MKIAIIGHGKMGQLIERIALSRGHEISCIIDRDNISDFESDAFRSSDVAIEFTVPASGFDNVAKALEQGVPVVSGTTGWSARLPEIKALCASGNGSALWSSNFSIGVNIFRALNRYAARIMNSFPEYTPSMTEVHHVHKLDHPSGTAITLAEDLIATSRKVSSWAEPEEGKDLGADVLPISHQRRGEVPGIHTIAWDSPADSIILTHSAKSREGFAMGAVIAAEWLASHPGFHTMGEMLSDYTATEGLFI